jgi:DNA-binding response OmpR family regulator
MAKNKNTSTSRINRESRSSLNSKPRVLIVDDDDGILDALTLILEEEGFVVSAIAKGDETYTKVAEFKPDLILLDVLMSGRDGREICKNLKKDPRSQTIPIIMISAHPTAKKGAQDAGADDFLPKPFETKALLETIEKHLK